MSFTKGWTKTNPYNEIGVKGTPYLYAMTTPKGCIHPSFKCRDYLQDFFWVENLNPPGTHCVYGFSHKYTGAKKFYMILQHDKLDPVKNLTKLKAFWNLPDQLYPLKPSIKNKMLVFDATALKNAPPYMVSFVSGLTRLMYFYDKKYPTLLDFLKNIEEVAEETDLIYSKDVDRIIKTLPMIKDTYTNGFLPQEWSDFSSVHQVHDYSGFVSHFEKVKNRYAAVKA